MTNWLINLIGTNWKTKLAAAIIFVLSVPAFVGALTSWAHHQPADWRGAFAGVVVSIGLAVAKDGSTHSTIAQVKAATDKANKN